MLDLRAFSLIVTATLFASPALAASSQTYNWKNVKIGGGGGFVPGIVFNPLLLEPILEASYKLNSDDTWTPLLDFADDARWNYWGVDALATDPVETNRLYLATGILPFKVGGNMPGRGMGERLVVDPNNNAILFFGARSGNGLYKSTNYGSTWSKVSSLPSTGTYVPDPTDTSGYNSDIIGISWVTFDSTSGSSGSATPRIFVGVANQGSSNIFVSENGGSTWSAVAGQNTTYIPHKGVLSPKEHVLYVSYSNGAGPYDGTLGSVYKYNISSSTWTDITPATGSDLYFGFGGLSVDLQKPGTLMVAALNSWWPDGQIYRSTDSGATWTPFWAWNGYPNINKYYTYSDSLAPWLGPNYVDTVLGDKQIGWMMESLSINPFDSSHFLYGTGATIYGSHDLAKWDTTHNITLKSLADGIEETSVQALISPPSGPHLLSAVGDIEGFVHNDLDVAPNNYYTNPTWTTSADIDYAGNKPTNIVRIGTGDSTTGKQVAISTDSGATWTQDYGAADNVSGGKVAFSADGDTVLWRTGSNGVQVSQFTNSFTAVSSLPSTAAIASDKLNNSIFYGAAASSFYLSTDGGKTFSAKGSLGSGLFHSTNLGASFSAISGMSQAWAVALGAPASTGGYPAVFATANYGGIGYFRSDDAGVNWVKINDASHGFGSASANCLAADPRIYGRVYIGTNGRGIFYGDVSGSVSTTTSITSTTKAVSTTSTTKPVTTTTTSASAPTTTSVSGAYGQCRW
ncbi:hypothetical protein IW261DRAFT_1658654 [Armillaria novae-zelandiae]|uniref:Glycoside hydrolase family 74 protein n=1 Tax=Armillaria novae-zelandiae TaxID=153914 RepID=A0AA39NWG7_9AGAR|nr:hypothetical protein IW261DRAFT_1658654 [Armillaria novae-zelandiae]